MNFRCRGEAERVVHVQTLTLASEQWRDSALALEGLVVHGARALPCRVHVQTLTLASEQRRDSALALEGLVVHGAPT